MRIEIEVLGTPKPQARARHYNRGGFSGTYDPSKGDKESFLSIIHQKAPREPITGPIQLTIVFYMPRPKGHYGSGKKQCLLKDSAPEFHTGRPDIDNIIKFYQDSMNKVFWKDDSQICWIEAQKKYSERPRTHLIIQTL